MTTTDLIIIGAGPGGLSAARLAAEAGQQVTIFEAHHVGGTCLNEGCIPTKALAHDADLLLSIRSAGDNGLSDLSFTFNYSAISERKDRVVEQLRSGAETLLSHPAITLVKDMASFADPHTITDSKGNSYTANNIIVATGSVVKQLPLEHGNTGIVYDSRALLAADGLPQSLCIIGAGVIGMEIASIYNAFGVEVTVVEYLRECLPMLDSEIAKRLRKSLERRGITFLMQSAVKDINEQGVVFERKGKKQTIAAERVLMAVGRAPRVTPDFSKAGFSYDNRHGIVVDTNFQTTVKGVYAIGDVNGLQMLAHAAEMQAQHVINHIVGRTDTIRQEIMPAAIFTNPEAAFVGSSEDQCRQDGIEYSCQKSYYRANGKAVAMGCDEGMIKLLADIHGRIIGCHAFGAHAADIVQEVSVLMCRDTTLSQLHDMTHIHPTLSEMIRP